MLELEDPERRKELDTDGDFEGRTGVFTSGIVATQDQHQIALFFTGQKHAGENLTDLLAQRTAELSAPIQMCDGLSRNLPEEFATLLARCNAHARRKFIDVESSFPDEVRHVLETLAQVYRNDAITKERDLSTDDRLLFHQAESAPLLQALRKWFAEQFAARTIEPNSVLGDAIEYMTKHWDALTLFLRVPGAPLDNNVCERVLKKAILHRKTAFNVSATSSRCNAITSASPRIPPRGCPGTTRAPWLGALRPILQRSRRATTRWAPDSCGPRPQELQFVLNEPVEVIGTGPCSRARSRDFNWNRFILCCLRAPFRRQHLVMIS